MELIEYLGNKNLVPCGNIYANYLPEETINDLEPELCLAVYENSGNYDSKNGDGYQLYQIIVRGGQDTLIVSNLAKKITDLLNGFTGSFVDGGYSVILSTVESTGRYTPNAHTSTHFSINVKILYQARPINTVRERN